MNKKKWTVGIIVAVTFGLLSAGAGVAVGMTWQAFVAVLCTSLGTHLGAYLMKHPVDSVNFDTTRTMRTGTTPPPDARLLAVVLAAGLTFAGCTTLQRSSIETKAYAVTRLVVKKVLDNNPGHKAAFIMGRESLRQLATEESIGLEELMAVIEPLPWHEWGDKDTGLYLETAVLVFGDDLGRVAVKNPEEVRLAATGMLRALDKVL